jgi:hypothetical protein
MKKFRVIGIEFPNLETRITVGDFDNLEDAQRKAAECNAHKNFVARVVNLIDLKALARRAVIMDQTLTEFLSDLPPAALLQPQEYIDAYQNMRAYQTEICEDMGATFD